MTLLWFISCITEGGSEREELYAICKKVLCVRERLCMDLGIFEVPLDLRFSSFDELLRVADELEKEDIMVEGVLKKAKMLGMEIDPNIEFKVNINGRDIELINYISHFNWDDAKFPKYISISDNLKSISKFVTKLLEDLTIRTSSYNELKHKKSIIFNNMDDNNNTLCKDLIYIITPDIIEDELDFIYTEHITTVVIYIPIGNEDDFLKNYMKYCNFVIPNSAKKLNVNIKNYTCWRVIIFKSNLNIFIDNCKNNGFIAQQFIYSKDKYNQLLQEQSKLEADTKRQQILLSKIYHVAYSDIFIQWIHLKAMRLFCESVLKFGLPVKFASYYLIPKQQNSQTHQHIHKILRHTLPNHNKITGLSSTRSHPPEV